MPHAVRHHARAEHVRRAREPLGERAAAAGGLLTRRDLRRIRLQHRQKARRDVLALRFARFDRVFRTFVRRIGGDEGIEQRFGLQVIEFLQLDHQRIILRLLLRLLRQRFGSVKALALILHLAFAEVAGLPVLRCALLRFFVHHGADIGLKLRVGVFDRTLDARLDDGVDLRADVLRRLFPFRVLFRPRGLFGGGGQLHIILPAHGREEGAQAVVILLQDGVELVVVALRAAHAQAHEDLARAVRHVGEDDLILTARIALIVFVDRIAQVGDGHQHVRVLRRDLIARELLAHELVVRLVVVKALDDVVAVRPRRRTQRILIVAIALRPAREV